MSRRSVFTVKGSLAMSSSAADVVRRQPALVHALAEQRHAARRRAARSPCSRWSCSSRSCGSGRKSGALAGMESGCRRRSSARSCMASPVGGQRRVRRDSAARGRARTPARLTSCSFGGKLARIASSQCCFGNVAGARSSMPEQRDVQALRCLGSAPASIASGVISTPPGLQACWRLVSTCVGSSTTRKSASPGGHHRAEHLGAEAHVAGDRAAALAHAVDFALLHVEARRGRRRRPGCRRPSARPGRPARRSRRW